MHVSGLVKLVFDFRLVLFLIFILWLMSAWTPPVNLTPMAMTDPRGNDRGSESAKRGLTAGFPGTPMYQTKLTL